MKHLYLKQPMLRIILISTLSLLMNSLVMSQNPTNDFTYQIYYETTSNDTAVFDPLCTRICKVTVADTSQLATVHIRIGTVEDGTDILNYSFQYDNTVGLPAGLTYLREQNIIYLGLYTTLQSDMYYYAVSIEDTNGNISLTKKWY
ncbi:MAG: hypothetical protein ABIJ97_18055 [Bacteroidota bacterium]